MKNRTALITGATSGIGQATARVFAKNGIRLILCGRREDRLNSIASELKQLTAVHTLLFDVRDRDTVFEKLKQLPEEFSEITGSFLGLVSPGT